MTNKPTETQVNRIQADAKRELAAIASANAAHAAEIERKCRERVSRPDVAEGLINILQNRPPEVDKELLTRHEDVDRLAESIVARWYAEAGSKYRALYFLFGADQMIRHVVKKALDAYPAGIDARPDELVVFSTSQPGDYWKITSFEALEMAMHLLDLDLHCDLDLFKGTDQDLCLKDAAWLHNLKELDKEYTLRKYINYHQREYIPQNFATVPFAVGNTIVLLRMCTPCYGAWIYRNQIDTSTNRIGEIEPISDGFGQVGVGPIQPSEYIWNETQKKTQKKTNQTN
ncbi:hypothetical protein [Mycobacterium intracellulare]|uniref:hypothetical protein n=1 Tax=Mycobacterium intracellulare TaxID=1767 RepID=UPI001914E759|nr:hypothetical protein [Mycobacterium intracellulare]